MKQTGSSDEAIYKHMNSHVFITNLNTHLIYVHMAAGDRLLSNNFGPSHQ